MVQYLAITIGPVYKTIKQARSTREIWAASYIFSIIMREIIKESATIGDLLSPTKLPLTAHRFGAGIYPDRAFWLLTVPGNYDALNNAINNALKNINLITGINKDDLRLYLNIYGVTIDSTNKMKTVLNTGIAAAQESDILRLNQLLDNLELQEKISNPKPDLLAGLVGGIQNLYKDGHQNIGIGKSVFINYSCNGLLNRLPSIIELTTGDLKIKPTVSNSGYTQLVTDPMSQKVCDMIRSGKKRNEYNSEEDGMQETIFRLLKDEYKDHFRFRHKYIAFIKADGDYMGKALGKIGNTKKAIQAFSDLLSTFAGDAAEKIALFGGLPIYAGGDDLLFTLPVVNNNEETIGVAGRNVFELIQKLDDIFPINQIVQLIEDNKPKGLSNPVESPDREKIVPSLSYGISFCYYKYPMEEILKTSSESLQLAKKFKGKNAVAFQVRKHSGQTFSACFAKQEAYKLFYEMLSKFGEFKDDAFLTSVMFKLIQLEPLLADALKLNRMANFFRNQFNEKDHNTKYDNYLNAVRSFGEKLYHENNIIMENESRAASSTIATLFSCLRFVQFINQEDHE